MLIFFGACRSFADPVRVIVLYRVVPNIGSEFRYEGVACDIYDVAVSVFKTIAGVEVFAEISCVEIVQIRVRRRVCEDDNRLVIVRDIQVGQVNRKARAARECRARAVEIDNRAGGIDKLAAAGKRQPRNRGTLHDRKARGGKRHAGARERAASEGYRARAERSAAANLERARANRRAARVRIVARQGQGALARLGNRTVAGDCRRGRNRVARRVKGRRALGQRDVDRRMKFPIRRGAEGHVCEIQVARAAARALHSACSHHNRDAGNIDGRPVVVGGIANIQARDIDCARAGDVVGICTCLRCCVLQGIDVQDAVDLHVEQEGVSAVVISGANRAHNDMCPIFDNQIGSPTRVVDSIGLDRPDRVFGVRIACEHEIARFVNIELQIINRRVAGKCRRTNPVVISLQLNTAGKRHIVCGIAVLFKAHARDIATDHDARRPRNPQGNRAIDDNLALDLRARRGDREARPVCKLNRRARANRRIAKVQKSLGNIQRPDKVAAERHARAVGGRARDINLARARDVRDAKAVKVAERNIGKVDRRAGVHHNLARDIRTAACRERQPATVNRERRAIADIQRRRAQRPVALKGKCRTLQHIDAARHYALGNRRHRTLCVEIHLVAGIERIIRSASGICPVLINEIPVIALRAVPIQRRRARIVCQGESAAEFVV